MKIPRAPPQKRKEKTHVAGKAGPLPHVFGRGGVSTTIAPSVIEGALGGLDPQRPRASEEAPEKVKVQGWRNCQKGGEEGNP